MAASRLGWSMSPTGKRLRPSIALLYADGLVSGFGEPGSAKALMKQAKLSSSSGSAGFVSPAPPPRREHLDNYYAGYTSPARRAATPRAFNGRAQVTIASQVTLHGVGRGHRLDGLGEHGVEDEICG